MLTWFGWFPALPDVSIGANNGCSVISFLFIYIIGRYIKLYGLPQWFVKRSAFIYVMCSILLATIAYCALKYGQSYENRMNGIIQRINAGNDPLVIISAMAFFSFFRSLKMKDSKIINYIAKSTLAVLLFHGSGQFMFFMMPHFRNLYDNYYGLKCAILWLLSVLAIGAIAVAIDQLRLLSFKLISPWLNRGAEKIVNSIDNQI